MIDKFINKIFNTNESNFDKLALEIFYFQAKNNPIYKSFIEMARINYRNVLSLNQIPFLPVSFFKTHKVLLKNLDYQTVFKSSGTGGSPSNHFIHSLEIYKSSFTLCFNKFFGSPDTFTILALLPSYLERSDSSLVFMAEELIKLSKRNDSGFYLDDFAALNNKIEELKKKGEKILLIGVGFALVDFSEKYQPDLSGHILMETGGMKGRKREMLREELHELLCKRFNLKQVYSEYGMTELLSQAYSLSDGIFQVPDWMRILIRDRYDPFNILDYNESGLINIIDLANIASCSFIATDDTGIAFNNKQFKVSGRAENAPLRGCNLLYE